MDQEKDYLTPEPEGSAQTVSAPQTIDDIVDSISANVLADGDYPDDSIPQPADSQEEQILDEMVQDYPSEEVPAIPNDESSYVLPEYPSEVGMTHPDDHPTDMASLELGTEMPLTQDEPFPDDAFRATGAESEEFREMFDAPAEEPAQPVHQPKPRQPRKGRPARKKGDGMLGIPHLMVTVVWLAIILAIGVSLGRMLWLCATDILAFGREDKAVTITIEADDTIEEIAEKLHDNGLIHYPGLFKLYASLAVDDGDISTGTFTLNTLYDYHALVGGMSSSSSYRSVVSDVLIPEGYTCAQIFALLEEKGICTVAKLEEYAASGEFKDFWFLEGVERGDKYCLEGFLFPDTYDFYAGSTPREAIGKMLLGFEARIDQEKMTTSLATLNETISAMMRGDGKSDEYIAQHQLSLQDLLTVASLIEEETASATESATIASVIYNRLYDWGGNPPYLNFDSTIVYAQGGDATTINTSIDSPYNTYLNPGLTPGPISNPGLDSITAALNPENSSYYYFVYDETAGLHRFTKTYEDHQKLCEELGY